MGAMFWHITILHIDNSALQTVIDIYGPNAIIAL